MKVNEVLVDEIPKSCGECCLLTMTDSGYICPVVPRDISDITGSPYDMTYRRSDCPLKSDSSIR